MYGYGNEDLYTHLRTEASYDNPYSSQRETGNLPEFLQGQNTYAEKNLAELMINQKRNNLFEGINSRNKVNGSKEASVFNVSKIRDDNRHIEIMPAMNFEDAMFGNPYERDFGMEISMPENSKFMYQNKRSRSRSSSLSGKDYPDYNVNLKNPSTAQKSKQARHRYSETSQNYLPESRKTKEHSTDKLLLNNTQFVPNNLPKNDEKEVEIIDLESIDTCDSNPDENKSSSVLPNNDVQATQPESDCECITEIIRTPKRNCLENCPEEIGLCAPTVPVYSNQHQTQASIIEKLVKETVSVEFDAIRQILYLQQMLLFRHLHKLEVHENHNSSFSDFILKVIEELMHGNKQLKKAVLAQQRKT